MSMMCLRWQHFKADRSVQGGIHNSYAWFCSLQKLGYHDQCEKAWICSRTLQCFDLRRVPEDSDLVPQKKIASYSVVKSWSQDAKKSERSCTHIDVFINVFSISLQNTLMGRTKSDVFSMGFRSISRTLNISSAKQQVFSTMTFSILKRYDQIKYVGCFLVMFPQTFSGDSLNCASKPE